MRGENAPRHILITGGATGLGFGMANAFVEAGEVVSIVGRRGNRVQESAAALGNRVVPIQADITIPEQRKRAVSEAISRSGEIDVLINNAGAHLKVLADEMDLSDFERIMAIHVTAAVGMAQLVIPAMKRRREGNLLFVGSMTTLIGMPKVLAYSAAKSAIGGIVRSLAVELGELGIRVNGILPGWIETPMLREALDGDAKRSDRILERTPLHRFGSPKDIGAAARFLAGDAAHFITGVLLPVDGGAAIGF